MSTPDPTLVLNGGQELRLRRARLLERARAGEVSLRDALNDPVAGSALAFQFVAAARYSRHCRAATRERRILMMFDRAGIKPYKTVAELSEGERDRVCEEIVKAGHIRKAGARSPGGVMAPRRSVPVVPLPDDRRDPKGLAFPGPPLAAALESYAARTGRPMSQMMEWAGSSYKRFEDWRAGAGVKFDRADRALSLTDLLWWEVWPPEEFPEVAAIFEPEAVAA